MQASKTNMGFYGRLSGIRKIHVFSSAQATFTTAAVPVRSFVHTSCARPRCDTMQHSALASMSGTQPNNPFLFLQQQRARTLHPIESNSFFLLFAARSNALFMFYNNGEKIKVLYKDFQIINFYYSKISYTYAYI